ncbi:hypothetical protein EYC80_009407 [Monilinia laxa]|uniref:Uncharacterized protein n=1 Tax=Monilinia laxa TaxID=61186 RepID=A0A5N6JXQ1_MONLA|nr:hypothetical protein EYC80_009407 [Monilinia laxa]
MSHNDPSRLRHGELEIGYTEAVERYAKRHVVAPKPVSQRKLDFENSRPRWMREMAAEAMGVFFFVTCGGTSGGHFNAAVTISCAAWLGFPWKKVPQYIFAQVFGSFMAAMLLIGQYYPQLTTLAAEQGLEPEFTRWTRKYPLLLPRSDPVIRGIVIWACHDPMNPFVSVAALPWVIGLGYATMIWGFADVTIELNSSRDLGARIVAAIFFGEDAFSVYSAIPILTSIPAMLFGTALHEMIQRDSFGVIAKGHNVHERGQEGVIEHLSKNGVLGGSISNSERSVDSEE